MTHSVESRFFAIVCGALLVFVVPLFVLFMVLSSERATKEQKDHTSVLLTANAQALGKPLWDFDTEGAAQIVATVMSDTAVVGVRVRDTSNHLDISRGTVVSDATAAVDSLSRDIVYTTVNGAKTVGTITVYVSRMGLFSSLKQMELAFISIFIFAIIAVFAAAIIGNRLMIITPLLRLTAAIEATRRLGSRHHVDWQSSDEMGNLANSFNEMQSKLERDEKELKLAHRRATDIYNLTPAMLFSIEEDDRITAVSDYWLVATGYKRGDVIGKRFSDMVDAGTREDYRQRKQDSRDGNATREVTVKFICADGRMMDVLIAETRAGDKNNATLSLSVMTDITELKEAENRNHRQALTDHLTGLMNRQGFEISLAAKIKEANARDMELACLFIDLDRFKWINDNLGHAAGDAVLCQFVGQMDMILRDGDIAARLGGDEFAVLLIGKDIEALALEVSGRMGRIFDRPFFVDGAEARLSASIGVALYPRHARNAAELLQKSDMAMYAKKRDGKNGAVVFDPAMLDNARHRAEIESCIEAALAEGWFDAYFQPVVDLDTRAVVGFEALMRMIHPQKGLMAPAEIISIAEETGSIIRIGNAIMERSLAHLAQVSSVEGMENTYLAINFSPLQFEPGLPARIASALARHGIKPSRIVVEITEAVLMHDNPEIRTILDELSNFGCRIALDDFGTGYSSLSYLNRFPVDIVKVDQSFTRALTDAAPDVRQKSRMLAEGITTISHKMQCQVIAEGVETHEQWAILKQMGVDCGQGYFFARPQPLALLLTTLSSKQQPLQSIGAA